MTGGELSKGSANQQTLDLPLERVRSTVQQSIRCAEMAQGVSETAANQVDSVNKSITISTWCLTAFDWGIAQ
jgi:hypothetical protein